MILLHYLILGGLLFEDRVIIGFLGEKIDSFSFNVANFGGKLILVGISHSPPWESDDELCGGLELDLCIFVFGMHTPFGVWQILVIDKLAI